MGRDLTVRMGRDLTRWRRRRYERSLRTVPVGIFVSLIVWFAAGREYFWPGWVILGGGLLIGLRARRAFASPPALDE
jgi:hypothetical protein